MIDERFAVGMGLEELDDGAEVMAADVGSTDDGPTVDWSSHVPEGAATIMQLQPGVTTIWDLYRDFPTPDVGSLIRTSFASAGLSSGCSGIMISPHIYMTAAHCGGPGWTGNINFLFIDEDAAAGASTQQWSGPYEARTFPWQLFGGPLGNGDFCLWWVSDGPDGVAPGIRHGWVDISPDEVTLGTRAYSFWFNDVASYDSGSLPWTRLYSSGSADARYDDGNWPGPRTVYSLFSNPGASGSAVLVDGRVVGVTQGSATDDPNRVVPNVSELIRRFDADRNQVLDAVEYDWLMTSPRLRAWAMTFDSPLKRAFWVQVPPPAGESPAVAFTTETGPWAAKAIGTAARFRDCLWHRTARFEAGATYRISIVAKGTRARQRSRLNFWSDALGRGTTFEFTPRTEYSRIVGQVTLPEADDHRLAIGTEANSDLHVVAVCVMKVGDSGGFATHDERWGWEMADRSIITAWGIGGAGDYAGLVAGPSSNGAWSLRNRWLGFAPNTEYTIDFRTEHVSGATEGGFAVLQDLGGNDVGERYAWAASGGPQHHRFKVRTDKRASVCLAFGEHSDQQYHVDGIAVS